jgi:hypothetical protein
MASIARGSGNGWNDHQRVVTEVMPETGGLVLTLDPGLSISGRVVDDDDSFFVDFFSPRTDSRGRFEYRDLGAGQAVIHAQLGDLASEERKVRVIEDESVEVQLQLKE